MALIYRSTLPELFHVAHSERYSYARLIRSRQCFYMLSTIITMNEAFQYSAR